MTKARREQISLSDTPWYHIVNRCVRRAYLCGTDRVSGQCYEHRRGWIEQRILQLASVFAIDVAAYAVMSNHYHLVVRVDCDVAKSWSDNEVLERWTKLFTGPSLVRHYLEDSSEFDEAMLDKVAEFTELYRKRLHDISWFMRVLNESIARMANSEDGVTGRFWEGRFKSQALLDEQAILSVMAYVDLNPVRAGIASDLQESEYTSIKHRITGQPSEKMLSIEDKVVERRKEDLASCDAHHLKFDGLNDLPLAELMAFDPGGQCFSAIPFALMDYLEFVDYLGRAVHSKKRGRIPEARPKLMAALGLEDAWIEEISNGSWLKSFGWVIGRPDSLRRLNSGPKKGVRKARLLAA